MGNPESMEIPAVQWLIAFQLASHVLTRFVSQVMNAARVVMVQMVIANLLVSLEVLDVPFPCAFLQVRIVETRYVKWEENAA